MLQELEGLGLHAPYYNVLTAWLVTTSRTKLIPSGRGICTPRQVRSVNGRGKLSLGVHQSVLVIFILSSTLSPLPPPTRSPYRSAKTSLRFAAESSVGPAVGSAAGGRGKRMRMQVCMIGQLAPGLGPPIAIPNSLPETPTQTDLSRFETCGREMHHETWEHPFLGHYLKDGPK